LIHQGLVVSWIGVYEGKSFTPPPQPQCSVNQYIYVQQVIGIFETFFVQVGVICKHFPLVIVSFLPLRCWPTTYGIYYLFHEVSFHHFLFYFPYRGLFNPPNFAFSTVLFHVGIQNRVEIGSSLISFIKGICITQYFDLFLMGAPRDDTSEFWHDNIIIVIGWRWIFSVSLILYINHHYFCCKSFNLCLYLVNSVFWLWGGKSWSCDFGDSVRLEMSPVEPDF